MFDSSLPQMPYVGAMSKLRRLFRLLTQSPRGRKTQLVPANAWLRRDVGLPRETDARPSPYLYR